MRLVLNSAEQRLFGDLFDRLLSPFPAPDEAWHLSVVETLKQILAAPIGASLILRDGTPEIHTRDHDQAQISEYLTHFLPLDDGLTRAMESRLEAWGQHLVWDYSQLARTPLFNEYMKPQRRFDGVGYLLPGERPDDRWIVAFHMDRPHRFARSPGQVARLQLAMPALKAALRSKFRLAGPAAAGMDWLEALDTGLLVFSEAGHLLHMNARANAFLGELPDSEHAWRVIRMLVEAVRPVTSSKTSPLLPFAPEQTLRTTRGAARLCAVRAGNLLGGDAIVVTLDLPRGGLTDEDLRERFGLTPRESQVARLVAQGHRNDVIARQLFISPHTVRHHTEQVRQKLGVTSRAEVAARLADGAARGDGRS